METVTLTSKKSDFARKKANNLAFFLAFFVFAVAFLFVNIYKSYSQTTVTFNYTGAAQTWTVPAGVTSITVDAYGAKGRTSGANVGGLGANIKGINDLQLFEINSFKITSINN